MPTPRPLDPLFTLGDVLLQLAPHNVLAKGGITISPVMGRQPTLYEEMNRPVPPSTPRAQPSPVPASKAPTAFDLGDGILKLAPHNVLATLFGGGQTPSLPGRPPELPASVNNFADLPTKVDLTTFRTGQSGGVTYFASNMALMITGKGNHYDMRVQDRDFITLFIVRDQKPSKVYETGPAGIIKAGLSLPTPPKPTLPLSVPEPPGGFGFIRAADIHKVYNNTSWIIRNTWGHGEKKEQTGSIGPAPIYTVTEYDERLMVYLVPPIAPTKKDLELRGQQIKEWDVRHPPAAPVEGLDAFRARYLSEVDGWIGDAQSKITEMKFTDIAQANSVINEIGSASSGLSQANTSGQAPAIPLFAGAALPPPIPIFKGGALLLPPPLPFVIRRGGQAGSASGYVSSLNSLLTKARSVKAQMDRDEQLAETSLSNMQTYRSGIATASDKSAIEYNHTRAKSEYDSISDRADSVHQNAAQVASLRSSAKSSYDAGIASITGQAPPGADAAAQAAAERARQIAESERLEAESAANEARARAEAEAERARSAAQQQASREELQRRIVAEREAAAAKAAAAQAAEEERIRQLREKYQKEEEARRAEEQRKLEERRQKLESVSAEAARLRQEAARKKLKK